MIVIDTLILGPIEMKATIQEQKKLLRAVTQRYDSEDLQKFKLVNNVIVSSLALSISRLSSWYIYL